MNNNKSSTKKELLQKIEALEKENESLKQNLHQNTTSQNNSNLEPVESQKDYEPAGNESEEYRSIVHNAVIGVFRAKLDGQLLYHNDSLMRMLDFECGKELLNINSLIKFKDPRRYDLFIDNIIKYKKVTNFEITYTTINGNEKVALINAVLFGNTLDGTAMDITERKKIEKALRASEDKFRQLFEMSPVGMALIDYETGKFLEVNEAVLRPSGYTKDEFLKLNYRDITPKEYEAQEIKRAEDLNLTGRFGPNEKEYIRKDGVRYPIKTSGFLYYINGKPVVWSIIEDIIKQKNSEQALYYERSLLRTLIDNVPDLIYVKDIHARKTLSNKSDLQLMGLKTEAEVLGKDDFAFFPFERAKEFIAEDKKVIETGEPAINIEGFHIDQQGTWRWFITSKYPLRDASGKIIGLAGIGRDITEHKLIEIEKEKRFESAFKLQSAIVSVSSNESVINGDILAASKIVAESVASVMKVDRAGIWLLNEEKTEIRCVSIFDSTHLNIQEEYVFLIKNCPRYFNSLNESRYIDSSNAQFDLRTSELADEYFKPRNINSALNASIRIDGQVVGLVSIEQINKIKLWEPDEINFASEIADQVALTIINSEKKKAEHELRKHLERQTSLVKLLRSDADTINKFLDVALEEAIKITDSKIGYIYHYDEDKKEFILNSWSNEVMKECSILEKQRVYQLDKTGIWGEAVRQRKEIIINDYQAFHPLKKGYPEGHVTLKKFLTIPLLLGEKIVAVVGVGNKAIDYDKFDVMNLQLLMNSIWGKVISIKAEAALKESEEKYKILFRDSPDAYLIIENGVFIDCNKATEIMMNAGRAEIIGKTPAELSPEFQQDGKRSSEAEKEKLDFAFSKGFNTFEWVHRRSNGEDFCVEVSLAAMTLNNRQLSFTTWRDITARKMAEEALRESEAKFQTAFMDSLTVLNIISLESRKYVDINDAFIRETGYLREEVIGKTPLELQIFYKVEDRELINTKLLTEGFVDKIEVMFRLKSGEIRPFLFSAKIIEMQGAPYILASAVDIKDRKIIEEALKQNEARLHEAQAIAHVGSWELDLATLTMNGSEEAKKIYGINTGKSSIPIADMQNAVVSKYRQALDPAIKNLVSNKTEYNETFQINRINDGALRWIHSKAERIDDDSGKPIKITGTVQDITDWKNVEDTLRENETNLRELNATKDKLFSIIAHDLKSPFQGFIGLTEMMSKDIGSFTLEEISTYNKEINQSANNLMKLLQNLLDWSLVQRNSIEFNPQKLFLNDITKQNIDLQKQKAVRKKINIVNEIDSSICVYADEKMLNSIFRNVLSNAVKFTDPGGEIILRAKEAENGMIEIIFKDTGIGIPGDLLNKLFKIEEKVGRIGTAGEESTSLGLTLCKEFVDKHGGRIWADSKEGIGSTFYFTIPSA